METRDSATGAAQRPYYTQSVIAGMTAQQVWEYARAEIEAMGRDEDDWVVYAHLGDTPCKMRRLEAHIRRVPYVELTRVRDIPLEVSDDV